MSIIQENVSLQHLNTFGIEATARYFAEVQTIETLQDLLSQHPNPFILGGGSNILFINDIERLVIHNQIKGIVKIEETSDHVLLKTGAGENWHQLVLHCLKNNYAGVENLSLIPGTVGAAPIQNIGAYGVELKDVFHSVDYIEFKNPKKIHTFSVEDCQFGYRDSVFKHALKNKVVITHVTLRLNKKPIYTIDYGALKDLLKDKVLSIKSISDAVITIRQSKLPDPKILGNAGSFFKNPVIAKEQFEKLHQQYPKMPYFPDENDHVKIPAAWLIEQCGFKGKRFGNIGIHAQQALVIVNYGHGLGKEIKKLSEEIQAVVKNRFKISLNTEVNICDG